MVLIQGQGICWTSVAAEPRKVLKGFPFKILLTSFTSGRASGSQIKEGPQTMVLIQGPGICWTTPFAEMILDWIRNVLE